MPKASFITQRQIRQHGAMEYTEPPADLDEVRRYRLGRVREQLKKHDYAGALLFDQINTRYVTDATNMQIWCSHYETRCVFVATEGPVVLMDYSNHPHLAEGLPTVDEYRVMKTFYYFSAGHNWEQRAQEFGNEIDDLINQYGGGNKRLAVDVMSYEGTRPLLQRGIEIRNGQEVMEQAKLVKSHGEIVLMRKAIEVSENGLRAMEDALVPGITENALWARLHEVNIAQGGEWIETRLLSSGPRSNPWFRESSMRAIEQGDMVSVDTDLIGPYGYCSDISRAWVCDAKPTAEQRRLYAMAVEQIEYNKSLLKAGIGLREISENAWPILDEFIDNRYSCVLHGVGLADEYPSVKHWIDDAQAYDDILPAGSTVCVESYIGAKGGREGVKLEEQVLITENGCEMLSTHPLHLDWL